jgi:glycosyltransferase involved in cell wall biosynthesis
MPSIRLLCTITAYPPSTGGAQLYLHHLLMHSASVQPEVVSFWDRNRSDWLMGTTLCAAPHDLRYELDGVPVDRLGLGWAEKARAVPAVAGYYGATRRAAAALARPLLDRLRPRARRADVVHCVRVGREPLALASEAAAREAGRPFVFTPLHHPRWGGWRHRVYIDLYRRADRVIALTEAEKATLVDLGVRPDAIAVVGVGPIVAEQPDPAGFRSRHAVEGPLVLFLGQHFRYKGFAALLAAAPRVWRRHPEVTFAFVGPPVGRSERAFRDADPRVRRLGIVDLQVKTDALAACDVLCVPSTQESFGTVLTEAWSFGKPVVGGDCPATREVVDDGVDGLLVAQDADAIAERLTWLLDHGDDARRMGEAGRSKVEQQYAWPVLAGAIEKVYASVA